MTDTNAPKEELPSLFSPKTYSAFELFDSSHRGSPPTEPPTKRNKENSEGWPNQQPEHSIGGSEELRTSIDQLDTLTEAQGPIVLPPLNGNNTLPPLDGKGLLPQIKIADSEGHRPVLPSINDLLLPQSPIQEADNSQMPPARVESTYLMPKLTGARGLEPPQESSSGPQETYNFNSLTGNSLQIPPLIANPNCDFLKGSGDLQGKPVNKKTRSKRRRLKQQPPIDLGDIFITPPHSHEGNTKTHQKSVLPGKRNERRALNEARSRRQTIHVGGVGGLYFSDDQDSGPSSQPNDPEKEKGAPKQWILALPQGEAISDTLLQKRPQDSVSIVIPSRVAVNDKFSYFLIECSVKSLTCVKTNSSIKQIQEIQSNRPNSQLNLSLGEIQELSYEQGRYRIPMKQRTQINLTAYKKGTFQEPQPPPTSSSSLQTSTVYTSQFAHPKKNRKGRPAKNPACFQAEATKQQKSGRTKIRNDNQPEQTEDCTTDLKICNNQDAHLKGESNNAEMRQEADQPTEENQLHFETGEIKGTQAPLSLIHI